MRPSTLFTLLCPLLLAIPPPAAALPSSYKNPPIHRFKELTHPLLRTHLRRPRPAYLHQLRSLRPGQLQQRQSQVLKRLLRVYTLRGGRGSLVPVIMKVPSGDLGTRTGW